MTASGVNLHSGDAMHAHISYDGTTLVLTLTDIVTEPASPARKRSTSGTVGAAPPTSLHRRHRRPTSVQQVLNWTFVVN